MSAKPRIKMRAGSHLGEVLTFPHQSLQNVMKALAQVEELAVAGEIDGIAIAIVHRDGSPNNFYVKGSNRWTLLGAIQRMKSRVERDGEA